MASYTGDNYVSLYLKPTELQKNVARCVEYLTVCGLHDKFDTIAFRGMSGAIVAPPVALALGKELIMVRKGESSHSCYEVEGNSEVSRVLIVDDFVASGETVMTIRTKVRAFCSYGVRIIGCLEYRNILDRERYKRKDGYLYDVEGL